MNLSSLLRSMLQGLPEVAQYMIVILLILLILYVCLLITRLIGQKHGEKVKYDNPEEYEKQIPDLFASTMFRRKPKTDIENEDEKKPD